MGKKRKALSQEEIWDDSALIQSWDDALEEYKLYHSIHARGERVEDVLLAAQTVDQLTTTKKPLLVNDVAAQPNFRPGDESLEDGELEGTEAATSNGLQPDVEPQEILSAQPHEPNGLRETHDAGPTQELPALPQGIIAASTQEEAAKNLMMSWYWAGYYTGFYEGQKQAGSSA